MSIIETAIGALGGGGVVALIGYLGVRRTAAAQVEAAAAQAEPAVIEQVRGLLAETRTDMAAARAEAEAARLLAAECERHRDEDREARRREREADHEAWCRQRDADHEECQRQIASRVAEVRDEVTTLARRLQQAALRSGAWDEDDTGLHDVQRLARRRTPSRPTLAQTPGLRLPERGGDDRG